LEISSSICCFSSGTGAEVEGGGGVTMGCVSGAAGVMEEVDGGEKNESFAKKESLKVGGFLEELFLH